MPHFLISFCVLYFHFAFAERFPKCSLSDCVALVPKGSEIIDHQETIDAIKCRIVSVTPNITTVFGGNVSLELRTKHVESLNADLRINSCPFNWIHQYCTRTEPDHHVLWHCLVPNVTETTKVQFLLGRISLGVSVCLQPFFIEVEEPPESAVIIENSVHVTSCGYLSFQFKPIHTADTRIKCTLFSTDNNTTVLYYSKECTNDTIISLREIGAESGNNYTLSAQTIKTVAKGDTVIVTLSLIIPDVKVTVFVNSVQFLDEKFFMKFIFKFEDGCNVTMEISTNCSNHIQTVSNDYRRILTVNHEVFPNIWDVCTYRVYLNNITTVNSSTTISSHHLQDFTIFEISGSLVVHCLLVHNTVADGCLVVLSGTDTISHEYKLLLDNPDSILANEIVNDLPPDQYTVKVYDLFLANISMSNVALITSILIPSSTAPITSLSQSTIIPLTTSPVLTTSSLTSICESNTDTNTTDNYTTIAILGAFLLVAVIVIIIFAVVVAILIRILIVKTKSAKHNGDVIDPVSYRPNDDNIKLGDTQHTVGDTAAGDNATTYKPIDTTSSGAIPCIDSHKPGAGADDDFIIQPVEEKTKNHSNQEKNPVIETSLTKSSIDQAQSELPPEEPTLPLKICPDDAACFEAQDTNTNVTSQPVAIEPYSVKRGKEMKRVFQEQPSGQMRDVLQKRGDDYGLSLGEEDSNTRLNSKEGYVPSNVMSNDGYTRSTSTTNVDENFQLLNRSPVPKRNDMKQC